MGKLKIVVLLVVAVIIFSSFTFFIATRNNVPSNIVTTLDSEWTQLNGDSAFTRFSSSFAPSNAEVTWQADISDLHSYLTAFDGFVFAVANDTVFALYYDTGVVAWSQKIRMDGSWPVVYKLDDTRLLVESSCLETSTGRIIWNSDNFCADTSNFNANVYVPEEKMFYRKFNSFIEAWDFSDLSRPPVQVWATYVPGGGIVGSGVTYGDGKIFPGSLQDQQIAIDAKTGEILWSTPTKSAMIFSGSYADGKYVRGGTDDNTMYCFDAKSGKVLWTYPADTSGYFCTGTAIGYGMVYAPNKDGYIYAIDLDTGNLVWRYKGPGTMIFPGTPTVADGKVYVTSGQSASYGVEYGESQFACLNAFTGDAIWTLPIEAYSPRDSVAIAYGYLYIIPGEVTKAVDSVSGSEYDVMGHVWAFASDKAKAALETKTVQLTGVGNFFASAADVVEFDPNAWSMFRKDAVRSSISGGKGPENLSLIWSFATNGAVVSSPSIVDGVVYFGSQDHNIYAVNAETGRKLWSFKTTYTVESSMAIVDGKVVTGGEDGYVYCLNAKNGKLLWKTFVDGKQPATYGAPVMLKSSPAIIDNTVYIGSLDGHLYALNLSDGEILWRYQTGGWVKSSPAISGNAVYITSETPGHSTTYKIDRITGNLIWSKKLAYEHQFIGCLDVIVTPTVADGKVFTSTNLRAYYCLDDQTGNIIWTFTNDAAIEPIISTPIYIEDKLYIVDKFDITCLNATTGKKIWNTFTGDEYYIAPSYADNKIYIVTSERNLFIFDATTGQKIEYCAIPSASWSSPTPYNGKLYIGCKDWNIYCLGEYNTDNMQLALKTDKNSLKTGESLTITGQLTPSRLSAAINLVLTDPHGQTQTIPINTNADGTYAYKYVSNINGDHTISATYYASIPITSQTITFTTNPQTSISSYLHIAVFVFIVLLIVAVALFLLKRKH
ncbi:MAG: PQQ-binding-like beta-propeller repeat protein [Nitrososphaerota archaeon]|jgi:outer membrane protein assembly factor BamB|nr:PQQ-binding-like beta-propeller repeat protein [Nitrososphaerota archaeon]